MDPVSEEEKELNSILEVDLEALEDLGLADTSFKQPGGTSPQPLEKRMESSQKLLRLQEAWSKGNLADGPSGLPLLRGLEQMSVAERTLTYKATMLKNYDSAVQQVRELYDLTCLGEVSSMGQARSIVGGLLESMERDRNLLLAVCLFQSPSLADYLYRHSVNTCVLSLATAVAAGFSRGQIMEIGQGALFSDVGMCLVPESIRLKNGKLTEDELREIHKHPSNGFALLEKIHGASDVVLGVAYQHHERLTGAGYPQRRSGGQISQGARVIAIADTLSAMVHKRSHRDALTPQAALDKVIKMGQMNFLDASLVKSLLRFLSVYPIGSFVELASGRTGRVVEANAEDFTRPVVSVLRTEKGLPLPMKQILQLDLYREKSESIVRVIDGEAAKFKALDGF